MKVQESVEQRLNSGLEFVHPYCLSLDSIGNALSSLVANKCITKQTIAGDKVIVKYTVVFNELNEIAQHLQNYGSVLKGYHALSNYVISAKL